jgi:squalene synthase HpnC
LSSDNLTMNASNPSSPLGSTEQEGLTDTQGIQHYENFPVASLLCPARLRPPIAAIYHFARTADDIADEGTASPAERLAALAAFRADLNAVKKGLAVSERWPSVFAKLGPMLHQWQLPMRLLTDLLSAFEQDVVKTRYANQEELLDYCRRSANPIGRLLLHLYGLNDAEALAQSDSICTALQLVNFWQDLSEDIPRGRIYLPAAMQARHGVTETELFRQQNSSNTRALVAESVGWARQLMRQGAPLVKKVPGRAGWELRLVVQGGLRIAERIEQLDFATLQQRPVIGKRDALIMGWRAFWM